MKLIKRFGIPFAVGLCAVGLLLTILSFSLSRQQIRAEIWLDGSNEPASIQVDSPIAANWLLQAGIPLFPNDNLQFDGISIPFDLKLPARNGQRLVYKPAVPVLFRTVDEDIRFYSGAQTLGEALWENNIFLKISDDLSLPMNTPLNQLVDVTLIQSQLIRILFDGNEINVLSSSQTVGGALAEAGIPLQFLDYSLPEADQPIPMDGAIQIIRVREEILSEERVIPFTIERVSDPEMAVGEEQVLQAGEDGIQFSSVKIRYEDEKEVERTLLTEWVSKAPITQRVVYGGNVVVQTFGSSEGSVDYWLKKEVYITSYLDTGSTTASGVWPYFGSIAVTPEWYSILKGTSIYVPGYGVGTVLDVCPGCVGKPWIDVFIPTDQYVPWSRTETVYFLPPAPDGFTGELP
jgi:resuscitation-promoting factor RpfB